jgi:hypothetical protein
MTVYDDPRSELLDLSARLRHLTAEHGRAGAGGAVRRRLEADMRDLASHLDTRLSGLLDDETDRAAWREHARHGGPAPDRPEAVEVRASPTQPPTRPSGRRPWPR